MVEQNRVVRLYDGEPQAPVVKQHAPQVTTMDGLADGIHKAITGWVKRYVDAKQAKHEDEYLRLLTLYERRSDAQDRRADEQDKRIAALEKRERG